MINVELPATLQEKLLLAAKAAGVSERAFIVEVLAQAIEDWEDVRDAKAALAEGGRVWTLEEILRKDDMNE